MRRTASLTQLVDRAVIKMTELANDPTITDDDLIDATLGAIPWRDVLDVGFTAIREELAKVVPVIKTLREESKSESDSLDDIPWR